MKNLFFLVLMLSADLVSAQAECQLIDSRYSGFCILKHKNGKTSWIKEYKNGKAVGTWMYFDDKGDLTKQLNTSLKNDSLNKIFLERIEVKEIYAIDRSYENESWSIAEQLDPTVKQPEGEVVYSFVEEDAQFNGEMQKWIKKNLIFPLIAKENGIQGKCNLKFVVEKDGSISNVSVVKGVPDCPECDKEAIRVLKLMPKWKPAKNMGKTVRAWSQIPFSFVLE